MKSYIYSEARENLAEVLDTARKEPVRITRRNGDSYTLTYAQSEKSPFDIPGIKTDATLEDILAAVRESREGWPGRYGIAEPGEVYAGRSEAAVNDGRKIVQRGQQCYEEREGRPLRSVNWGHHIGIVEKGTVIPAGDPPLFLDGAGCSVFEFQFLLSQEPCVQWLKELHELLCAPWNPKMPYFLDRREPPKPEDVGGFKGIQNMCVNSPLRYCLKFEGTIMALVCTTMYLESCWSEVDQEIVVCCISPDDCQFAQDEFDQMVLKCLPSRSRSDEQILAECARDLQTRQQRADEKFAAIKLFPFKKKM